MEISGEGWSSDAANFIKLQRATPGLRSACADTLKLYTEFIVYIGEGGMLFRESQFLSNKRLGTSHTWLGRRKEQLLQK